MDFTAIIKNAPLIFGLSIVGVLGFFILLAVGLNMYRQEGRPPAPEGAPRGAAWRAALRKLFQRSAAPAPTAAGAHEVLRVLRHPLTGRLMVEIAGRRYAAAGEIADPETAQGLQVTLRDLQRFAGAPPADAAPADLSPAASAPPRPPAGPPAEPAPPALNALPAAAAPAAKPAASPPALRVPSMNPFRQLQVLREMGTMEPPPPQSIAAQIDAVLQQLIAGTPFAARGLAVQTGPRDSVVFLADGVNYADLAAVPDEAAQAVFREAIRQWEAR